MSDQTEMRPGDERKLRAYERLHRLNQPPLQSLIAIPVFGTLLGQLARLWYAKSVLVTSFEDALSGVSNQRLVWTTLLAFGVSIFILLALGLYTMLSAELDPSRLWVAQIAVGALIVLGLPYLIEAVGLFLGTILHTFGGSSRSLHMRMNQFHKPRRNIFSPRR